MKKVKHILLLLLYFSTTVFSQSNTFIIKVVDSKAQVDSVIMGYRENATVGIDENLDEYDYYEIPNADLDIRSIQRDSITQNSAWLFSMDNSQTVNPFLTNIDLKKDFRPHVGWRCEHFIVQVNAKNYPVSILISYLNFDQDIPYCGYQNNIADETIYGELNYLVYRQSKDTIVTFYSPSDNCLIGFHPQFVTNLHNQYIDKNLILYPNPANNYLIIESNNINQNVVIFDCKGIIIEKIQMRSDNIKLNVSNYPNGLYFVLQEDHLRKFVKK